MGELGEREMQIARIHMDGGALLLPARTPYEREVVLDHVRHRLRLHGFVQLEMNGRRCRVEPVAAASGATCAGCARRVGGLACRLGAQLLCIDCALDPTGTSRTVERGAPQPLAG
jgi:hypothetical protein